MKTLLLFALFGKVLFEKLFALLSSLLALEPFVPAGAFGRLVALGKLFALFVAVTGSRGQELATEIERN